MVCDMLHCLAWIHNKGAHPYIHYYNRAAVLACTASGVAVVSWYMLEVLRRCDTLQRGAGGIIAARVGLVSWSANGSNNRKSACKAPCAVLWRGRYNCIDSTKHAVNACAWLYCIRAKQKPCTVSDARQKKSPAIADRVKCFFICWL